MDKSPDAIRLKGQEPCGIGLFGVGMPIYRTRKKG
jgi:hypothetical protein